MNLLFGSIYSLEEGIESLSHFTKKYINTRTIYDYWYPLSLLTIIGGICLLFVMLCMARMFILKPIELLMGMTDLIMGRKNQKKSETSHKALEKLKSEVARLEHRNIIQ